MDPATQRLLRTDTSSFIEDIEVEHAWLYGVDIEEKASIAFEKPPRDQLRAREKLMKAAIHSAYIVVMLTLVIAFCAMAVYILDRLPMKVPERSMTPLPVQWKSCGNSSKEARERGCALDFIDRTWIPSECYDAELVDEFLQAGSWQWYTTERGQETVSKEVIGEGDGPEIVWVTDEYHWVHCQYTWMKLHRAVLQQKPIDSHLNRYSHTIHCAKDLALHFSELHGRAQFTLGFASCPI